MVPGQPAPASDRLRSNPPAPAGGVATAAARSVYYPRPPSPTQSRSMPPHKSSPSRPGYPQGPRQLSPTSQGLI